MATIGLARKQNASLPGKSLEEATHFLTFYAHITGRNNTHEEIDGYSNFVFVTATGSIYLPSAVNRAIERARVAYNKEEIDKAEKEDREPLIIPHFSAHNLRHTFCTRFCENESNLKIIQSIMGHTDISTTMDVYAEATQEKKQEIVANLQGKIII